MATKKKPSKRAQPKYATLHDLMILKMQALLDIEQQIIKALPKMAKAASDPKLKAALTDHLAETRAQADRIAEALKIAEAPVRAEKAEGIRGIIKDAEWCIKNVKVPEARDVVLIAAAQYVEHYEMAGYGAARAWAEEMGHNEIVDLLQTTLDEEGAADKKLTSLAEGLMGMGGLNKKPESGME